MQYTILCVGKLKEKYYIDAVNEYSKRMSRYSKLEIIQVADEKTPDHASELQEQAIKEKEADRLMKNIKDSMYVVALDIQGKQRDSVEFADLLSQRMV